MGTPSGRLYLFVLAAMSAVLFVGTSTLAADINVGSTPQNLIDAIANANPNDVLILTQNNTYTFSAVYTADPDGYGPIGLPKIDKTITINGNGATLRRSAGNFRFFYVASSGSLTIQDLTISNGSFTGANAAMGQGCGGGGGAGVGGAILNVGTLTLDGITFTGNTVRGGNGAADATTNTGGGGGGGLGGNGSEGVGANGGVGGGVNGGAGGVAGTPAGGTGGVGGGGGGALSDGGLHVGGNGGFGGGGGGASYAGCCANGGTGGFGGGGGGYQASGPGGATGDPGFGGGIATAWQGGGGGGFGGAVFNKEGTLTVVNCTFSGNSAYGGLRGSVYAAGGDGGAFGGAVFNYNGSLVIANSTIVSNILGPGPNLATANGGGVYNYTDGPGASLTLANTIIANNSTTDAFNNGGTVTAPNTYYNLIKNNAAGVNACGVPYSTADPNLGPLASNGGPTQTYAPLPGSPALDVVPADSCPVLVDQRGHNRPQNCLGEIGSYEADALPTVCSITLWFPPPANATAVSFSVTFSESVDPVAVGDFWVSTTGNVTTPPSVTSVWGTGITRTVTVNTGVMEGTLALVVSDPDHSIRDLANNPLSGGGSSDPRVTDTMAPTVTITQAPGQADPTSGEPIVFRIAFNEAIDPASFTGGVGGGDVTITGTAGGTKVVTLVPIDSKTWNAEVRGMGASGTVIAGLAAGVCTDLAGNNNLAAPVAGDQTVTWQVGAPTVTINQAPLPQTDPTMISPINFSILFNVDIDPASFTGGVGGGDVSITGTAGGTKTVTLTHPAGDTKNWNAAVTGMTTSGTVIANIHSGVCVDAALNSNAEATFTDNQVNWDMTPPTVNSVTLVGASPTKALSVDFLVTFSESVTGGGTGNFAVTGIASASVTAVSPGPGATRTVTVATGSGDGTIRLDAANSTGIADLAGNAVSNVPFTTGASYTIDKSAPTGLVSAASPASWTNADSLNVTFSASDPSGIGRYEVAVDGGGYTTQSSPYSLNVTAPLLADGMHTVHVKAYDSVGNVSAPVDVTIYLDNVAPVTFTPTANPASWTKAKSVAISFSTTDDSTLTPDISGINHYEVAVDSDPTYTTQTSPYSLNVSTLGEGTHMVHVKAYDNAGNVRGPQGVLIYLDKIAPDKPVITTNGGANFLTVSSPVNLAGTCASDTNEIHVNDSATGVTYTPGDTTWSYTGPLSQGANLFTVTALDVATNESVGDVITVSYDNVAPTVTEMSVSGMRRVSVTFDEPMGASATTAAYYTVSGLGQGSLTNHPNSVTRYLATNMYDLTWDSGEMKNDAAVTITVSDSVQDVAGNGVGSPNSGSGTGIGEAPTVLSIVRATPTQYTHATSVTWRVTFSESVKNVDFADFVVTQVAGTNTGLDAGSVSASSGTVIDVTAGPLAGGGELRLDALATSITDDAGNPLVAYSGDETYVVDTEIPVVVPTDNYGTADTKPTISGLTTDNYSGIADVTVRVTNGSTYDHLYTAVVTPLHGNNPTWSADVTDELTDADPAPYTVTVTATDRSGNVSADSVFTLTKDVRKPSSTVTNSFTKDTTPTVSGTAKCAIGRTIATVNVTVNGVTYPAVVTLVSGTNYTWTANVSAVLAEGGYTVRALATDDIGQFGGGSVGNLQVDLTKPIATVTPLTTSVNKPVLEGTLFETVGMNTLTVTVNGVIYSATLTSTGSGNYTWSAPITNALLAGKYNVTTTARDLATNVEIATTAEALIVDMAPPLPFIPTATPASWTNGGSVTVRFSTTDATSGVDYYQVAVDGGASAIKTSPYLLDVSGMTDGTHTVSVEAYDNAGNGAGPYNVTIYLDKTAPTDPTVTANPASWTKASSVTLTFSATDATSGIGHYEMAVDGGDFATYSSPRGLVVSGMTDGEHTITVEAYDVAGNVSGTQDAIIYLDRTPPAVPQVTNNGGNDYTTRDSALTLVGTCADDTVAIKVNGATTGVGYVAGETSWTYTGTLTEGANTFNVTALDAPTNESIPQTIVVTLDTTGPKVSNVLVTGNGEVSVVFNEPMGSGVDVPTNYTVSGTGMGTLHPHPDSVTRVPATNTDILTWDTGEMRIGGDITITVGVSVQDAIGNEMGTPDSGTALGAGRGIRPTVTSIMRKTPDSEYTTATSVIWEVTFSKPVKSVTYAGFAVVATGSITGQAAGAVSAAAGTVIDVTAGPTLTGSGTLRLDAPGVTVITDDAGNALTDAFTAGESYSVDQVIPVVKVPSDYNTKDTTPLVNGVATDDFAGVTAVSVAVVGNGYNYTYPANVIPPGGTSCTWSAQISEALPGDDPTPYTVTVTATDRAGNVSASKIFTLTKDTRVPVTTVDDKLSKSTTPTLTGSASCLVGRAIAVNGVKVTVNAVTYTATVTGAPPNYSWSANVTTPLAGGAYPVEAEATDSADFTGGGKAGTLQIDLTPPVVSVTPLQTNNNRPTLAGSLIEAVGMQSLNVTVNTHSYVTTVTIVSGSTYSWTAPITDELPDGTYPVKMVATDTAGNVRTTTTPDALVVDTTSPTATMSLDLASPTTENALTFSVDFTEVHNLTFTIDDVSLAGSLAGGASVTDLTRDGNKYTVTVVVTDPNVDGSIGLVIGTGVTDSFGNAYLGGSSPLYTVRNWFGFKDQPQGAKKYVDSSATFAVTLNPHGNSTAITYQWWFDDVGPAPAVLIGGETSPTLTVGPPLTTTGTTVGSPGDYWCVVTYMDDTPEPSNHATLQVKDRIQITGPASGTAWVGGSYTFHVLATGGYPPLSYQWRKNATDILTATDKDYQLSNLQVSDSDDGYTVAVNDDNVDGDTLVSNEARVTVGGVGVPVAGLIGLGLLCGTFLCGGAFVVRRRK